VFTVYMAEGNGFNNGFSTSPGSGGEPDWRE